MPSLFICLRFGCGPLQAVPAVVDKIHYYLDLFLRRSPVRAFLSVDLDYLLFGSALSLVIGKSFPERSDLRCRQFVIACSARLMAGPSDPSYLSRILITIVLIPDSSSYLYSCVLLKTSRTFSGILSSELPGLKSPGYLTVI